MVKYLLFSTTCFQMTRSFSVVDRNYFILYNENLLFYFTAFYSFSQLLWLSSQMFFLFPKTLSSDL